jgi:hypothetical protein
MFQRGLKGRPLDRALCRREATLRREMGERVIRTSGRVLSGVDSRYDPLVATGAVDKSRWAAAVRRLMGKHAGGKKATFGKLVGVDPRTVSFWLDEEYTVREEMVRQVADRTGESAIELLIEVGVFAPRDIPAAGVAAEDAWIVEVIQSSTRIGQAQKNALIAVELERARREREEKRRRLGEQIDIVAGTTEDGR